MEPMGKVSAGILTGCCQFPPHRKQFKTELTEDQTDLWQCGELPGGLLAFERFAARHKS